MTSLYGIKNCDTVKKARSWLDKQGISYRFHDFRSDGIDRDLLLAWRKQLDWETLVNKRSTTWKNLDEKARGYFANGDEDRIIASVLANPTLIKRPVLERNKQLLVGFKEQDYKALFSK